MKTLRLAALFFWLGIPSTAVAADEFPYPAVQPAGSDSYTYAGGTMTVMPAEASAILYPLFSLKRMECGRIVRTVLVSPQGKNEWLWARCSNKDGSVYVYHLEANNLTVRLVSTEHRDHVQGDQDGALAVREAKKEMIRAALTVKSGVSNGISYLDFSQLVRETDVTAMMVRAVDSLDYSHKEAMAGFNAALRGILALWRMKYEDCGTIYDPAFRCEYVIVVHKGHLPAPFLADMAKRADMLYARLADVDPRLEEMVKTGKAATSDFSGFAKGARAVRITDMVTLAFPVAHQLADELINDVDREK